MLPCVTITILFSRRGIIDIRKPFSAIGKLGSVQQNGPTLDSLIYLESRSGENLTMPRAQLEVIS